MEILIHLFPIICTSGNISTANGHYGHYYIWPEHIVIGLKTNHKLVFFLVDYAEILHYRVLSAAILYILLQNNFLDSNKKYSNYAKQHCFAKRPL